VPPQSTSVSAWFLTVSLQVGTWHTLEVQTLLMQSLPIEHARPLPQLGHDVPPQSTAVSVPFFTLSLQVGVTQRRRAHAVAIGGDRA
jgi:hypothetical protein